MTYDEARQVLTDHFAAAFAAAYPSIPIEYENRTTVDVEAQLSVGPFVEFVVRFHEGQQVSLGQTPLERVIGDVIFVVSAPLGTGVAQTNEILQWFRSRFNRQQLGDLVTTTTSFGRVSEALGYRSAPVLVPFWFDSFT